MPLKFDKLRVTIGQSSIGVLLCGVTLRVSEDAAILDFVRLVGPRAIVEAISGEKRPTVTIRDCVGAGPGGVIPFLARDAFLLTYDDESSSFAASDMVIIENASIVAAKFESTIADLFKAGTPCPASTPQTTP